MLKSLIHSGHMVPLDTLEGFRIRPDFLISTVRPHCLMEYVSQYIHKVLLLVNFYFMNLMPKNHSQF